MKRHGLWQYHRAVNSKKVRDFAPGIHWWSDQLGDDFFRLQRMVNSEIGTYFGSANYPYRPMDALFNCAYRAMRRFRLRMNVDTWNAVVKQIARRAGYRQQSVRAVEIDLCHYRGKTPIYFDMAWGEIRVHARRCRSEVNERAQRFAALRAQRKEADEWQNMKQWRNVWRAKQDVQDINRAIRNAKAAIKQREQRA